MKKVAMPIRVLVVDDDAAVRASLAAFLEDEGFAVRAVGGPREALALLEGGGVDVALVDVRLPEMDGPTLILRAHDVAPGVRFVIYTGSVLYRLPEALEAIGMSVADVIQKPAPSLQVVADAVRRAAEREVGRGDGA